MNSLESDARVTELERALQETSTSASWRLTAPLRRLRRRRSGRRSARTHAAAPVRGRDRRRRSLIAFGSSISGAEAYRRYAEPGIRRAAEPDSQVLAYAAVEPVARTYNLILDAAVTAGEPGGAGARPPPYRDHPDGDFCVRVRRALSDPDVGAVGCAGARNVTGIAWWEGEVVCGNVRQRYEEHGGGEVPTVRWAEHLAPPAEVEVLDGQLLILSPVGGAQHPL